MDEWMSVIICGMIRTGENWNAGRKSCPSAICPPQIPHGYMREYRKKLHQGFSTHHSYGECKNFAFKVINIDNVCSKLSYVTDFPKWCGRCRYILRVKVKESCNRPGMAQRFPGSLGSWILWHLAHEGCEVVSLTHRAPLPPGDVPGTLTRGWVDPRAMVWSEGICH